MTDQTARQNTTKYAVERIERELGENFDWITALFVSAIYVDIRLRSLLTDRLAPDKAKWEEVHRRLGDLWGINRRITLCNNLGLITDDVARNLKSLWDVRSETAHESRIWVELKEKDKERIGHLCEEATKFLRDTSTKG